VTPNTATPSRRASRTALRCLRPQAAFVVIDVVGLPVRQHQQQLLALRLIDELSGGMTHRRADARVVARSDAPTRRSTAAPIGSSKDVAEHACLKADTAADLVLDIRQA
jgi:hypothetical protein